MSTGLLFITAPSANHKIINRLLLHLHDWQYGSGDRFHLISSRSVSILPGQLDSLARQHKETTKWEDLVPTHAPVAEGLDNEWSGASLGEIEAFCIELDKRREEGGVAKRGPWAHRFVVLDEDGLAWAAAAAAITEAGKDEGEQNTCVLAEREIDWDKDPLEYLEKFNKARVPWYETYVTWTNLDIANIDWDEMMMEEGDGGWWVFSMTDTGQYLSEDKRKMRDIEIERLIKEGKA